MSNLLLAKSLIAASAILKYRIVRFHTDEESVVPATDVAHLSIGVTDDLDVTTGEPVDVNTIGIAKVTYGAAVTAGQRLTAGADGKAVPVTAATDVVVGKAWVSGVADDVGAVKLI